MSAASAIALAGAAPSRGLAPAPPLPAVSAQMPAAAGPAGTPALAHRFLAAGLAITVLQARARAPRYTLTAYTAAHRHRGPRRHGGPRQIAWSMLDHYHWAHWQFRFLNRLWERESSWNPQAANPYSGAYGIPQAVPAGKMASAGRDWRWSARTQIRWGLHYIRARYGSPLGAWLHERSYGWY